MIQFEYAQSTSDLEKILELQRQNHYENLHPDIMATQGFVSVKHDLELLSAMNTPYQHAIAKFNDQLAGYALVMLRDFEKSIPLLVPMFEQINGIEYKGTLLGSTDYFIMGQVCVSKDFRGMGVFRGLYEKLREQMAGDFTYLITEVSARNERSLNAHTKLGMKAIKQYRSEEDGEEWVIFLWELR